MDNLLLLLHILGNNTHDVLSIRQLAWEANTPYTSTLRTINKHKELFTVRKKGNANLLSINKDEPLVKHYLIIAERAAANELLKKQSFLKSIKHDLGPGNYALVLFGSRAKNNHREQSDVDICVISKKGSKDVRFTKFAMLSGKEVNPLYFSDQEFVEMITSKEHNVGKEILRQHVVLYGEEYFWELVWPHVIR